MTCVVYTLAERTSTIYHNLVNVNSLFLRTGCHFAVKPAHWTSLAAGVVTQARQMMPTCDQLSGAACIRYIHLVGSLHMCMLQSYTRVCQGTVAACDLQATVESKRTKPSMQAQRVQYPYILRYWVASAMMLRLSWHLGMQS